MNKLIEDMKEKIKASSEEGITLPDAERLAAEVLFVQLEVSEDLKTKSLDARMRKSGVKAIRAAVYTENAKPVDGKKLTEAAIAAIVDLDDIVQGEQNALDEAEVEAEYLKRAFDILNNAHINYRQVAKGSQG